MSELTKRDHDWFYLANAGSYHDKSLFYLFKKRFLVRFGTDDGWDSQEVPHHCWTCNGTGIFDVSKGTNRVHDCRSCDGSGVHHTNFHWLHRYLLGGRTYHVPEPPPFLQPVKNEITGLIAHEPVCPKAARRAFLRLLLRHEPATFYEWICNCARLKVSQHWWRLRMRAVRFRNKMDLFPAVKTDDVPF